VPIIVQAALLGVVQGLTEFLPVSSSAHLILARAFFGWDSDQFGLAFDVACHVGTLVAVLIYFRREIAAMVASLPRLFNPAMDQDAHLIWLIAVGTIPAVVAGLLFKHQIEDHLRTPAVAAVTLALGAVGFFVAERSGSKTRSDQSLTLGEAFLIGCAQALALVPGVSRSGATLTVALLLGLRRADSARFIFLDPRATDFYADWEQVATDAVAILRSEAGRDPYDRGLSDLIGELSTRSETFRTRWAAHNVRFHDTGVKRFHHPVVGDLELTFETMQLSADEGLMLFVYTADVGSKSDDALNLLASWTATLDQAESADVTDR